jgi:hypothetical protein
VGAKSLGQTLIVLNLAQASDGREIAALRDFDADNDRFGSIASYAIRANRGPMSAVPQKLTLVALARDP